MSATIFAVRGRLEFIPTWMRRVGLKPDLQQRLDPVGLKPDLQRRLHRVGLKPDLQRHLDRVGLKPDLQGEAA